MLGVGFKGLPIHINEFGGPVVTVHIGRFIARVALQVIEGAGGSVDLGWSF